MRRRLPPSPRLLLALLALALFPLLVGLAGRQASVTPAPAPNSAPAPVLESGARGVPAPAPAPAASSPESGASPSVLVVVPSGPSPQPEKEDAAPSEKLWTMEEGIQELQKVWILQWRVENRETGAVLIRVELGETLSVPISKEVDTQLRQEVATLLVQLPKRALPMDKSRCLHWLDAESVYGRRYYCEGDDADKAFHFLGLLYKLLPPKSAPVGARPTIPPLNGGSAASP